MLQRPPAGDLALLAAAVAAVSVLFEIVGATHLARLLFGETPPATTIPAAMLIGVGVVLVGGRARLPPLPPYW